MKKYYTMLFLCAVAYTNIWAQRSSTKVNFITTETLRQVQNRAKESGKLVFIDFYANWCSPCNFMDETTFNDEALALYIDKNFVPYKVDVEDFEGYNIKQQFGVKILPTFLILNSKGEVLGRYEESMGAIKLRQELQKFAQPTNTTPKVNVSNPTTPKNNNVAPPKTPTVVPRKAAPTTDVPTILTPAPIVPAPIAPARKETKMPTAFGDGLYEFTAKKHVARGYSVQTNALGQLSFVLREVDKMQKAFPNEPVLVYISNQAGKPEPLYKIMVGAYDTEAAAEPTRAKLRSIGVPNPTTKNLATMR